MKNAYPTSEQLKTLLSLIDSRMMALPDFQRDFVWQAPAINELIESILSNFPAGTLLRIPTNAQTMFNPRAFAGAPVLDGNASPAFLVLDGQQRLTSLYQAFFGVGTYRFFLHLEKLESEAELEECIFHLTEKEAAKQYGTIEKQAAALVLPLNRIFGDGGGYNKWQNEVLDTCTGDGTEIRALSKRLNTLYDTWVKNIESYEFPTVTLGNDVTAEAVCTIFETLNRTGVKLSVFDLLVSRFWAKNFDMRQHWKDAKQQYPILTEFEIDPYYILQIIALLEPGKDKNGKPKAPSIKRGQVLEMDETQAGNQWNNAIEGLVETLKILQDDCGILRPNLLPYATMLIPFAAIVAKFKSDTGPKAGANKIKLLRWFWCSVFAQAYENSANSQAERDFAALQTWLADGSEVETVRNFNLLIDLRGITPKQRGVYRGVMSLILRNSPLDFHNRKIISAQMLNDKKNGVDDHHIFPQAFLKKQSVTENLRDCIVNRTFIDRTTNLRLNKTAPSVYFAAMRKEHGDSDSDKLLKSHFLPEGNGSPLVTDDFDTFLNGREQALLTVIHTVTS